MKNDLKLKFNTVVLALTVVSTLSTAIPALAHESEMCSGTTVDLSSTAEMSVKNDTARFSWQITKESKTPSEAMNLVSASLKQAVNLLKRDDSYIEITTNYQSYPINGNDRKISHWRVSGTLNYEVPLAVVEKGRLLSFPDDLALQSINYSVSKSLKAQHSDALVVQALEGFRAKANLVAKTLNFQNAQLIRINVQDQGYVGPQPMMFKAMSAEMAPSADVISEGGESALRASVNGQICLR